jgi:hypothetical protein
MVPSAACSEWESGIFFHLSAHKFTRRPVCKLGEGKTRNFSFRKERDLIFRRR